MYLGDLLRESVRVELFAEPDEFNNSQPIEMQIEGPIHGAVNGFIYAAAVPADRPPEHFTPRLVPQHPHAFVPAETTDIRWME